MNIEVKDLPDSDRDRDRDSRTDRNLRQRPLPPSSISFSLSCSVSVAVFLVVMLPLESSVGQGEDIGTRQLLTCQQTRQKDIEGAYRVMKDAAGKA